MVENKWLVSVFVEVTDKFTVIFNEERNSHHGSPRTRVIHYNKGMWGTLEKDQRD